jgi:hypothetical protein
MAAHVSGGTHAVDDEGIPRVTIGWVEMAVISQEAIVGDLTPIELGKERRKPFGVFVIDREASVVAGPIGMRRHDRPPVSGGAV